MPWSSVADFGVAMPILIGTDNVIIASKSVTEAARHLKLAEIPETVDLLGWETAEMERCEIEPSVLYRHSALWIPISTS
jgi:hypothetical protein